MAIKPTMRAFSTTPARSDLAKVVLIGRLGADPEVKKSTTGRGDFTTYPLATAVGTWSEPGPDGKRTPPPTSWHTLYAFFDRDQEILTNFKKGQMVYVEADLKMVPQPDLADGTKQSPRPYLTHKSIKSIVKPKED